MTQLNEQGSTGQQVPEQGAAVKDRAQEKAQDKAQQWGGQLQEQARTQVDARSTQIGEQVGSSAEALRSASHDLSDKGQDAPARAMQAAAERAERVGEYLRSGNYDSMLADVERYARTNPWAVMAGGVLVGVAASRFLKASSARRSRADSSTTFSAADTWAVESTVPPATPVPAPDLVVPTGMPLPGTIAVEGDAVEGDVVETADTPAAGRDVPPPSVTGGY